MAIDATARREGVATALVAAGRARALACGATRIDPIIDESNVGGVAFWQSCGFRLNMDDRGWSLFI